MDMQYPTKQRQFTVKDISNEFVALFIAMSHAIQQGADMGDTDEAGVKVFLMNTMNNYQNLLRGESIGVSQGSVNFGEEIKLHYSGMEPARKLFAAATHEAYNTAKPDQTVFNDKVFALREDAMLQEILSEIQNLEPGSVTVIELPDLSKEV